VRIVEEHPPNWAAICSTLPAVIGRRGLLFAWGDTLFNPDGVDVPPRLIAHEETHATQQGSHVVEWWAIYLASPWFRMGQEVLAHHVEWVTGSEGQSRQARRALLKEIATRLRNPIYGVKLDRHLAVAAVRSGDPSILAGKI